MLSPMMDEEKDDEIRSETRDDRMLALCKRVFRRCVLETLGKHGVSADGSRLEQIEQQTTVEGVLALAEVFDAINPYTHVTSGEDFYKLVAFRAPRARIPYQVDHAIIFLAMRAVLHMGNTLGDMVDVLKDAILSGGVVDIVHVFYQHRQFNIDPVNAFLKAEPVLPIVAVIEEFYVAPDKGQKMLVDILAYKKKKHDPSLNLSIRNPNSKKRQMRGDHNVRKMHKLPHSRRCLVVDPIPPFFSVLDNQIDGSVSHPLFATLGNKSPSRLSAMKQCLSIFIARGGDLQSQPAGGDYSVLWAAVHQKDDYSKRLLELCVTHIEAHHIPVRWDLTNKKGHSFLASIFNASSKLCCAFSSSRSNFLLRIVRVIFSESLHQPERRVLIANQLAPVFAGFEHASSMAFFIYTCDIFACFAEDNIADKESHNASLLKRFSWVREIIRLVFVQHFCDDGVLRYSALFKAFQELDVLFCRPVFNHDLNEKAQELLGEASFVAFKETLRQEIVAKMTAWLGCVTTLLDSESCLPCSVRAMVIDYLRVDPPSASPPGVLELQMPRLHRASRRYPLGPGMWGRVAPRALSPRPASPPSFVVPSNMG